MKNITLKIEEKTWEALKINAMRKKITLGMYVNLILSDEVKEKKNGNSTKKT